MGTNWLLLDIVLQCGSLWQPDTIWSRHGFKIKIFRRNITYPFSLLSLLLLPGAENPFVASTISHSSSSNPPTHLTICLCIGLILDQHPVHLCFIFLLLGVQTAQVHTNSKGLCAIFIWVEKFAKNVRRATNAKRSTKGPKGPTRKSRRSKNV